HFFQEIMRNALDHDVTSDLTMSPREAMNGVNGVYHVQEFARRAGVTVRALHHYDQLGLLKPSGRSAAGYRLYRDADLVRLQQIVTLKFIGLSLQQIREALKRRDIGL